ncbi:MAG: hypothetical protein FJ405_09895, partial [Verrucomicrobia bacterium]|nr:hypothetical protein [Verrucomicrobiota bacterium]
MRISPTVCVFLLLLVGTHAAFTTQIEAAGALQEANPALFGSLDSQYRTTQWKVEQGLPQNNVTALLQSSDGYIWAGTVFGLVRYDGVRFTVFEKATLPIMQETDSHVLALAEDQSGVIWVCTKNGLLRLKNHQWLAYGTGGKTLGRHQPAAVCPSKDGGVWVGGQAALMRFDENGLREHIPISDPPLRSIRRMREDESGDLWFGDRYTLLKRSRATGQIRLEQGRTKRTGWLRFLRLDSRGQLVYGGDHDASSVKPGGNHEVLLDSKSQITPASMFVVNDVLLDGSPDSWVVADGFLHQAITDSQGRLRLGERLTHPGLTDIETIMRDQEGNLWVATRQDGLLHVQEKRLRTLQLPELRSENDSWCVAVDPFGQVTWGTMKGVYQLSAQGLKRLPATSGETARAHQAFSLLPMPDGSLWVGFGGVGAHLWKGNEWQIGPFGITKANEEGTQNIRTITSDSQGSIWFGRGDGLFTLQHGQLTKQPLLTHVTKPDIRCVHHGKDGTLWVGTAARGLWVREPGADFIHYGKTNGLLDPQITCFLEDSRGSLWIGTGSGLSRWQGQVVSTLTRSQGLFDDVINWVLEDDHESLWISCNRGIYKIGLAEAHAVLDGEVMGLTAMPFGESDGMASAETNGGSQPSGWKGPDGVLWFPSAKGLVRVDPRKIQANTKAPGVVIEQVRANGRVSYGDGVSAAGFLDTSVNRSP